jgi:hypothetical protein
MIKVEERRIAKNEEMDRLPANKVLYFQLGLSSSLKKHSENRRTL